MSSLGFVIEDRGHCRCVVWDNGGVSPATLAECALWDALHAQPPAVGVDVSELRAAALVLRRLAVDTSEFPDWPDDWDWDRIDAALRTGGGAS